MSKKKKFSDSSFAETPVFLDDGDDGESEGPSSSTSFESLSLASAGVVIPPSRIHRKISLVGSSLNNPTEAGEVETTTNPSSCHSPLRSDQFQSPKSPKRSSKTLLPLPSSPKLGFKDSPKRKTTTLPSSPKMGFGGEKSSKKEKVSSTEEFNLDSTPLSPRNSSLRKKKSMMSPHGLSKSDSTDDLDAIRQDNRNLQMSLKLKEKEIADLKKRLEKEQKKGSKSKKKKGDHESSAIVEEDDEGSCLCHSLTFNCEFHLGNMVKLDECVPLDQYLPSLAKKNQCEISRTDSLDSARKQLDAQPWVIDPSEVLISHELSRGSSAHVLLGIYRAQKVAVKVMKSSSNAKHLQDFQQEFEFAHLVKSSYNVYFYGVVFKPALCLVMEFCARKSLHDLMRDKSLKITWRNTLKFMYDFVKAVSILHNWVPPLVHRDIKSMNILITGDWQLKLCDFGLTRATSMSQMEGTLAKVRGTYTHCAPEVFKGGSWSLMSDMYSVAVVIWEMCYRCVTGTHQVPYAEYSALKFDFQILMKASAGLRPTIPQPVPEEMKCLITKGWHENPENRISANELLDILNDIMENFDEKAASWPCMDA